MVTLDNTPTRKELTAIARFANAVPWRLAHREKFAAKAPGHVNGGSAPPTLSAYTRWPLGLRDSAPNREIQRTKVRVWLTPNTYFFYLSGVDL